MSTLNVENLHWFASSAEVVENLIAWVNEEAQHDAIVTLITYDLHEFTEVETENGPYRMRKNDMKYDTTIVLSYRDPMSGTNWMPDVQDFMSGYADHSYVVFVERGKRPRG